MSSKKVQRGTYQYLVSVELEIFTGTPYSVYAGCMDSGNHDRTDLTWPVYGIISGPAKNFMVD